MGKRSELLYWLDQGLTTRAANVLARRQLSSWRALALHSLDEIRRFSGVGETTLREIEAAAAAAGYVLETGPKRAKGQQFGKLPIPKFASEEEEREFWATHDSADYIDWSEARPTTFTNLKPSGD